jgi:hypothetical protein
MRQTRQGDRRQVLSIKRLQPGTHASSVLREGDILLAVGGTPVSAYRDVEAAVLK